MRYFTEKVEAINGFKYMMLETGRRVWFSDALSEAEKGHRKTSRWLSRACDLVGDEYTDLDEERLDWFLDDIQHFINAHRKAQRERMIRHSRKDRISKLRNTAGRTEEERALYLAKADQLEQQT